MQKVKSDVIRLDVINLLKTKLKKEGIEKCTPSSFEIDVATLLLKYNINFDFNQQIVHNTTTQIPKLFSSDLFLNKNTNSKSLNSNNINNYEDIFIFRPDFIIKNIQINNKSLIIEPHGKQFFSKKTIKKYKKFMDYFKHNYYFVIISDITMANLTTKLEIEKLKITDICNELIYSEKKDSLKNLEKRLIDFKKNEVNPVKNQYFNYVRGEAYGL